MKKIILNLILVVTSLPALAQQDLTPGKEGGGGNTAGLKKYTQQIMDQKAEAERLEREREAAAELLRREQVAAAAHYKKYKDKFCKAADEGFEHLRNILVENKIENPLFIKHTMRLELARILSAVCGPKSTKIGFMNESETAEYESGDPLIAKNYPKTLEIKMHPVRWDEKEKTLVGQWLLRTIATHEIISLLPGQIEKTEVYTWSSHIWQNKLDLENSIRVKNLSPEYARHIHNQLTEYKTFFVSHDFKDLAETIQTDSTVNTIVMQASAISTSGQCISVVRNINDFYVKVSNARDFTGTQNLPICGAKGVIPEYNIVYRHNNISHYDNDKNSKRIIPHFSNLWNMSRDGDQIVVCKASETSEHVYRINKLNYKNPNFEFCISENKLKEI